MKTKGLVLATFMLFGYFFTNAQRADGDVGLGFQFGQPSGVSLHFYNNDGASLDLLAAWDLDNFYFLNIHALWSKHLDDRGNVHFYYGPGGFIGVRERAGSDGLFDDNNNDVELGLSGRVGLGFLIDKFEIFGHVTPRISLSDSSDVDFGGGVGGRFYF